MQRRPSARRSPAASNGSAGGGGSQQRPPLSLRALGWRLLGLGAIDAVAVWFGYALANNGVLPAAIILLLITAGINWIFISDRLYPIRWLTPGLLMMLLLVIYPLGYSVYIAFTNYGDGHLLTKEQVVAQLEGQFYQPEGAANYQMTVYRNAAGSFLLLLKDEAGSYLTASQQDGIKPFAVSGDSPANINDYQKLPLNQTVQYLTALSKLTITDGERLVRVTGATRAEQAIRRFSFDSSTDTLTNRESRATYRPVEGTFIGADGKPLDGAPGFVAAIGFENFGRVFTDPNVQGPFFGVFIWTIMFALLTVLFTLTIGLGLAIVMNDKQLPAKGLLRSLVIIPYTIPGFISALVWVGLLNPYYGQFNAMIKNIIGVSPSWFSDGTLAKAAILLVNTWLGFPYMMIICLGALQSIPTDMYEAADLDGASGWQKFRALTLPLLMVAIGPVLIGVFAFNFNNFTVIELITRGGPPIAGSSTPAGQTDILLSYTYRLAFATGKGTDYGLASAISFFIFAIVASITAFNFRFTKRLEELT